MHFNKAPRIAFIGSVGIPNRYGGFEAFLEHTTPVMARNEMSVVVTCDRFIYPGAVGDYCGVKRRFVACPANGAVSVLHDLLAFLTVFVKSTHIFVLGVSGGIWFPFFRIFCDFFRKKLIVNVDGVEWQRGKFSKVKRLVLRAFNYLAQRFSHTVIIDNQGLKSCFPSKTICIAYPGDYVLRNRTAIQKKHFALTICRIEPENNIELLIQGVLASRSHSYTIIGNWDHSEYGISIREKYRNNPRVQLLDPIYDPELLSVYRGNCSSYIHGHSVGGTNPSLVEMLFYDCHIYCFDVIYHHFTVGGHARYFKSENELATLLNAEDGAPPSREELRKIYRRESIAAAYIVLCS